MADIRIVFGIAALLLFVAAGCDEIPQNASGPSESPPSQSAPQRQAPAPPPKPEFDPAKAAEQTAAAAQVAETHTDHLRDVLGRLSELDRSAVELLKKLLDAGHLSSDEMERLRRALEGAGR